MTTPGLLGQNDVAGIDGGTPFGAGAHERALGLDERDGLTLHVRTHERSVAFIVLEERNQRCADRHHLARGDVHVIDHLDRNVLRLAGGVTHQGFLLDEVAVLVELLVGLGDHVLDLAVSGHVDDLVGHMAVLDLAVRGLDEAEGVDAAEGRQRADEPMFGPQGTRSGTCGRRCDGCTSRTSMEARSRDRPPGPSAERRRLFVTPANGLF